MKYINKPIFLLFVASLFGFLGMLNEYIISGAIRAKWGYSLGDSTLHMLVVTGGLVIISCIYSFKKPKKEKSSHDHSSSKDNRRF